MELTQAHFDWSRRLAGTNLVDLRDHAQEIQNTARELGIWRHGGYIPLQPFVVDRTASDQLHRLSSGLCELLVAHALESAGNNLQVLADIAGLTVEDRWFLSAKRPLREAVGCRRPDVFVSQAKPYFLELNFGTCLSGATSTPVLTAALLGSPTGVAVRHCYDISAGSFFAARMEWVRHQRTAPSSAIALVGFSEHAAEGTLREFEAEAAYFAAHGIPCDFVPAEEADVHDGWLAWQGKRYDTAIRCYMVTERIRRYHMDLVIALEHAVHTRLIGAHASQLLTSKALLADLCQQSSLSTEQRLLLNHVPWTARLRQEWARRGEERVDPVAWAAKHRERAVLKPYNHFGSQGVVIGRRATETEWSQILDRTVEHDDYVVQELVEPDPWTATYWHTGEGALVEIESPALIGPFDIDGRSGGYFTKQPISGHADNLLDRKADRSLGCVVTSG